MAIPERKVEERVFPNRLREIREALKRRNPKWTQQYVAELTGLSVYTVHRLELQRHDPDESTKAALAGALRRPVDEVFPKWPNRVREFREALGWSREKLAKEAGVAVATIGLIESYRVQRPNNATKRALAEGLHQSVEDVFPDPERTTP